MNTNTNTTATISTATANRMLAETKLMIAAFGDEGLKDLREKTPEIDLYLNRERIRELMDPKDVKSIKQLIETHGKSESTLSAIRGIIIKGILTDDFEPQTDRKLIDAGMAARAAYASRLACMFGFEKDAYIKQEIAASGLSEDAFFGKTKGHKARSLFAATTGCPMTEAAKKAFTMALKRAIAKGVSAGKLSDEQAQDMMISFRASGDGIAALPPLQRGADLTDEQKAELERKAKKAAAEKVVNLFCELDGAQQFEVLTEIHNHSENIAALMSAVLKKAADLESRVELDEATEKMVSEARVLKREIEQLGKGNKRPTAKQTADLNAKLKSVSDELAKQGIDVNTL